MALNPELLALLACPVCRGELEPVDNESGLECPACGLVFPVRDNIPIMLQEAVSYTHLTLPTILLV